MGAKFNAELLMPFTVLVIVEPEIEIELEFIIGTDEPATPFIVVVKLFPDEVLLTLLTAFDVAATPFTVDVKVFTDNVKVLVVVGVAPFTKLPLASNPK